MVIPIWSWFWKFAPASKQTHRPARHKKCPQPASCLLRLESLEDRLVPSAQTWDHSPIPVRLYSSPPNLVLVTAALVSTPNQGQSPSKVLGEQNAPPLNIRLMAEPTKITDLQGQSAYQSRLDSFTSPQERLQAAAILLPLPESSLAMVGTLLTSPATGSSFLSASAANDKAGPLAQGMAVGRPPGPDAARIAYQIGVAGALEKNLSRLRSSLLDGPPPFDLGQPLAEVDLRPSLPKPNSSPVSEDVTSPVSAPGQQPIEYAPGAAGSVFWTGTDPEVSPDSAGAGSVPLPSPDANLPPVLLSPQENPASGRTYAILLTGVFAAGWSLPLACGAQATRSQPPRLRRETADS